MSPPTKPLTTKLKLNDDCWHVILEHHFGDFRTLSRIMQVCRQLLNLTAPVLYRQLDHSDNVKRLENWSYNKHATIARLLLTSSGYITSGPELKNSCRFYNRLLSDCIYDFYQMPLTLNYFGFLRSLPPCLIGSFAWAALMDSDGDEGNMDNWEIRNHRISDYEDHDHGEDDDAQDQQLEQGLGKEIDDDDDGGLLSGLGADTGEDDRKDDGQFSFGCDDEENDEDENDDHQVEQGSDNDERDLYYTIVAQRHARALPAIDAKAEPQMERWLHWTEEFSQLSKISLWGHGWKSSARMEELMVEFVTRHHKVFPGMLAEIWSRDSEQTPLAIRLCAIAVPKTLYVESAKGIQLASAGGNDSSFLTSLKEFELSETNEEFLKGPPSDILQACINFDQFLRHCRQLEVVTIHLFATWRGLPWSNLFSWAPVELSEAYSSKLGLSGELSSRPPAFPLKPVSFHGTSNPRMPLKVFSLTYAPARVLNDAANGFRYTLEKIVFTGLGSDIDTVVRWSWPLLQLTSLKLISTSMSMSILKLCPVLEDLHLEDVTCEDAENDLEDETWRPPRTLKKLSVIMGDVIYSLKFASIGELKSLEYLQFEHEGSPLLQSIVALMPAWSMPKMKYLRLESGAHSVWSSQLLQSCPNLESFMCSKNPINFLNSWWMDLTAQSANVISGVVEEEKADSESDITHGSRLTSLTSGIDNQLEVTLNIQSTKIKRFHIGGQDWTYEQIIGLVNVLNLRDGPSIISQNFPTTSTTILRPDVALPDLWWVKIGSNRYDDEERLYGPDVDQLLIMLMSRPKMRLVVTSVCMPSQELIDTRLVILGPWEIPDTIGWSSAEFQCSEAELAEDSPFCLLEINGVGDTTRFKLKQ